MKEPTPLKPRFFRDFTGINRLLLVLALLMLGFMASKKLAYRGWQRQYWGVGVCSRQANAFTLLSGDLVLADGYHLMLDEGQMVFDSTTPLCQSCENFYPLDYRAKTNFLLPPDTLKLAWGSLLEHRFYRGAFCLPKARIDSVFAHYQAHPDTTWQFDNNNYSANQKNNVSGGLMLGVKLAPDGRLSLHVLTPTAGQGGRFGQELAHFQATAYQPAWRTEPTYEFYFYAKTPQAYLDTLQSRLDSAGRYKERRWQPAP